jgi:endoribonuclease LACTB2
MNIVNVGYTSTNYYVIGPAHNRMLIDVGWPKTLPKLAANLKRKGIRLPEIRYLLVTHYHPDHAGLAQEMKNQGVRLLVLEPQVEAIPMLKTYMKPTDPYVDIQLQDAKRLAVRDSRTFLRSLGMNGEIISTPGHSDDSVTLVLDEGAAFTGDLESPQWARAEVMDEIVQSWQAILTRHAKMVYPGHGPIRPIQEIGLAIC